MRERYVKTARIFKEWKNKNPKANKQSRVEAFDFIADEVYEQGLRQRKSRGKFSREISRI